MKEVPNVRHHLARHRDQLAPVHGNNQQPAGAPGLEFPPHPEVRLDPDGNKFPVRLCVSREIGQPLLVDKEKLEVVCLEEAVKQFGARVGQANVVWIRRRLALRSSHPTPPQAIVPSAGD